MDSIWVYGNNNTNKNFSLTKLELITAFASISLWKHFYPNCITYLYSDKSVVDYLSKFGFIELWDNIDTNVLSNKDVYHRKAFWTIDKIRLFQHIKTPFTFLDFDFYIKKQLPNYLDFDYVVAFEENTKDYYPYYYDKKFSNLQFPKEFTFDNTAHNTCFFYVKNSDVTKKYTDMCLSYMKEINDVDGIHGGHSVFLEQTILCELSKVNNWNTKLLVDKKFNVLKELWTDENTNGFFSPKESEIYYRHLSNDKRRLDKDDFKVKLIQSEIINLTKKYNPHLLPILHKLCQ